MIVSIILAFTHLLLAPTAYAEEVINVPPGFSATLPAALPATVPVPFSLSGDGAAGDLTVEVVSVSRRGIAQPANITAAIDASVPLLELTFPADSGFHREGDYIVTLKVARVEATQLLHVAVTRPSVGLTVPAMVKVTHTVGVPEIGFIGGVLDAVSGSDVDKVEKPELSVVVGPDSQLRSLAGFQTGAELGSIAVSAPCPNSSCELARAQPVELTKPIGPNGAVELSYTLDDDFPLGVVTRTIELRSDELAGAKTVTFEITTRRTLALIPILAALGLLLGFLTRTAIAKLLSRLRSGEEKRDLIEDLLSIRERVEDVRFRHKLDDIIERARGKAAKNAKGRATLAAEADSLLTELNGGIAELEEELDELRPILAPAWLAPPSAHSALANVRSRATDVADRLEVRDVTGARNAAAKLERAQDALAPLMRQWWQRYQSALDELATAVDELDDPNELDAVIDVAKSSLPDDLTTELKPMLEEIESAMRGWMPLAESLVTTAGDSAEMREALRDGSDPAMSAVAAAKVVRDLDNVSLGGEAGREALATPPTAAGTTHDLPSYPRSTAITLQYARIASRAVRAALQLLRFIVLWLGFILLAFAVFSDGWVGNARDMLTVAFWAFGTDITVQALSTQTAAKLPVPSPAA
ncbi:MAG: hypothetical protein GY946_06810 [bacterium]|nr:hypothetical protein [bacterium]